MPTLMMAFEVLPDPRIDRTKKHSLLDIIGLVLIATICGADNWAEVSRFGAEKLEWLQKFLKLPNGAPSHDTIARVFALLDPLIFASCFITWAKTIKIGGRFINIDGKTLVGSKSIANDLKSLHVVTAWLSEAGVSLGHLAVEEKSNEITAIPRLLEIIDIKGKIVTIDAMGCQKDIAEKIVDRGGDYVLALKGNQGSLFESITTSFDGCSATVLEERASDSYSTIEKGHGRIEERTTAVFHNASDWPETKDWKNLNTIIVMDRTTTVLATESVSTERQYYISSLDLAQAKLAAVAIRGHWSIENQLHWQLDVSFGEDSCQAANRNAAQNLSTVRKAALKMLNDVKKEFKCGIKGLRKLAGWKDDILIKILQGPLNSEVKEI